MNNMAMDVEDSLQERNERFLDRVQLDCKDDTYSSVSQKLFGSCS